METILQILDIIISTLIYGTSFVFTCLFAIEMQLNYEIKLEEDIYITTKLTPLIT